MPKANSQKDISKLHCSFTPCQDTGVIIVGYCLFNGVLWVITESTHPSHKEEDIHTFEGPGLETRHQTEEGKVRREVVLQVRVE